MEPETPPAFSFDDPTAKSAADEILGAMPEPQQHAIDEHLRQTAEAENNAERDAAGVAFDPALHTGTKLKSGLWRTRKNPGTGGASVIGTPRKKSGASEPISPEVQQRSEAEAQARAAGIVAAQMTVLIGQTIGGEEWAAKESPYDEKQMLAGAYGDYFVSKNVTDFPPGIALCLALTMYAAPRFTQPVTRSRLSKVKTWIAAKIANRKLAREAKKRGISVDELRKEMGLEK